MKRIQITHKTEYYYKTPVIFGAHRALVRPREGHDVHIESSVLEIEPQAHVRWHRDIYGNSIAVLTFAKPGPKLSLFSRLVVAHYVENPNIFAGAEHVSIAVARDAERASPLSGAWQGPADAFDRMEVSVKVVPVLENHAQRLSGNFSYSQPDRLNPNHSPPHSATIVPRVTT